MYKQFTSEQQNVYEFRAHKSYTLKNSDLARYQFLSASSNSTSASYYKFARINFYLSGSDLASVNPKFNTYQTVGNKLNNDKMFFDKFYKTGSFVSIPQSHFGDRIKRSSFTLTDNSTSATIKIMVMVIYMHQMLAFLNLLMLYHLRIIMLETFFMMSVFLL